MYESRQHLTHLFLPIETPSLAVVVFEERLDRLLAAACLDSALLEAFEWLLEPQHVHAAVHVV